jgi:DNA topoisomerase VI subunit B
LARSQEYVHAFRAASKEAVAYVHELAQEMNDPQARAALNAAAFGLGVHLRKRANEMEDEAAPE